MELMIKDSYLTNILDEVDATVFSSDRLYNKRSLEEFKLMLTRWGKEADSIEEFLKVGL